MTLSITDSHRGTTPLNWKHSVSKVILDSCARDLRSSVWSCINQLLRVLCISISYQGLLVHVVRTDCEFTGLSVSI